MCAEDLSVSHRTGFRWWFQGRQRLSFINDFLVISSLCLLKISASVVELGCVDDFWVVSDSDSSMISKSAIVYVRWRVQRQPYNWVLMMISASAVIQFLSMISVSALVYVRSRFHLQLLKRVSRMISGSPPTLFLATISKSEVVYVHWRFPRPPKNWVLVMISMSAPTPFHQRFMSQQ